MKISRIAGLGLILWVSIMHAPSISAALIDPPAQITGEVIAINMLDAPAIIVLKARSTRKEDFIVGAIIAPGAKIMRGAKAIALETIKLGEPVVLTYTKTPEGLRATALQAK
jgi:hypothetical protein